MNPISYVTIASEESNTLAMLQQRPGESFTALLERQDHTIESAVEHDKYLFEINAY